MGFNSEFKGLSEVRLIRDKVHSFNGLQIRKVSKGKAIPLQAWTGPECSMCLRLPDFKTIGT